MEFELNQDPQSDYKYKAIFTTEAEVETMSAAYSEFIHQLSTRGNISSVMPFHASVAGWDKRYNEHVYMDTVSSTVEILDQFHDNTETAIAEIPEVTRIPAYDNKDIAVRYKLGNVAARISQELTDREALLVAQEPVDQTELLQDLWDLPEAPDRS